MRRNETKRAILSVLAEEGPLDILSLARKLETPLSHIRVYLWRYFRQGLLRKAGNIYSLSGRGRQRLDFLVGYEEPTIESEEPIILFEEKPIPQFLCTRCGAKYFDKERDCIECGGPIV